MNLNKIGTILGGIFIFGIFLFSGITIIETGNVGIKSHLGKIEKKELSPGVNWAMPIISKIEPVFTKTIMINYTGGKQKPDTKEIYTEKSLNGEDKTGLEMAIDMIVEVSPQPTKMADMYIEVGRQGFDKKVLQPIRGGARKVLGQFNAELIMSQRKEVEHQLRKELTTLFDKNPYYRLDNVQLKKIYLPIKVKNAIEAVQLAKQLSKKSLELVVKAQNDAKSTVAIAQGQANAMKIKAQGKANAIVIGAKAKAESIKIVAIAQAKANEVISKSLTNKILKNNAIKKWNGKKSKFQAGNSGLILDLGNLEK